jgi:subtilisin family serine protease
MRLALAAALVAALAHAAPVQAARYAVGVASGAPLAEVASSVEQVTGMPSGRSLASLGTLLVETPAPETLRGLPGVDYVERVDVGRRLAFAPNDPLAAKQWHLENVRAFDFWPELPTLAGPRVAIIDSGIDGAHPEFEDKIAAHRSFVGGSALTDQQGHGTFIAGLVAAQTNNAVGVAGIAFPAQLLVAKVVRANRMVSLEAEAQAIRWAVDNGARVINLSIGGLRDPRDPTRDTYSRLEAAAIRYAYTRGVVVVAAVGNGDQAPTTPWPYASYPAALPHVIGVSALARDGSVPNFSNRDPIYNDVAAPGHELVSTLPRQLTAQRPSCDEQGYSPCGSDEYRTAEGTSFAAPQVAAAAALVLSLRPFLQPDQVSFVLTRSADDVSPATGCQRCAAFRDVHTGWGRLDVGRALAALQGPVPGPDRFESNDDAGAQATPLRRARANFAATVDFWDDQVDVYKVYLRKRQRISITLNGPRTANADLALWKPGTLRVEGLSLDLRRLAARSARRGSKERIVYRAPAAGWYYVQVKLTQPGSGTYRLAFSKSKAS